MTEAHEELLQIANTLRELLQSVDTQESKAILDRIFKEANNTGKAWSGSFLGYHAHVYYETLKSPPSSVRFSPEWGLMHRDFGRHTVGNWREFSQEEIEQEIRHNAGDPDLEQIKIQIGDLAKKFHEYKAEVRSVLYSFPIRKITT